jgi:hypothetical protein
VQRADKLLSLVICSRSVCLDRAVVQKMRAISGGYECDDGEELLTLALRSIKRRIASTLKHRL